MMRILFFVFLIGVAVWYYRKFTATQAARKAARQARNRPPEKIATLVKDPVSGEYRLKRDGE